MNPKAKISPRLKRVLAWLFRAIYISLILGMLDVWTAIENRQTPFSACYREMQDGGTRRYAGFGYSYVYYHRIGGINGPALWYWFLPVVFYDTTTHTGVRWLWTPLGT